MFELSADELLSYFQGRWRLLRQVSHQPLMSGDAEFSAAQLQPKQLAYVEKLAWPGPEGPLIRAQRRYTYRQTDTGLAIDFADGVSAGSLFLRFDFERAHRLTAHHLCVADHYQGQLVFYAADHFELSFQVVGPQKDYQITTTLHR